MIALLADNRESIAGICPQLGVQRLGVFGSAASGSFDAASSDVNFVGDPGDYGTGVSRRHLGLIVALESLLDRRVDAVTLLRPSGCGKTTMLRMIGGFVMPAAGEVFTRGEAMGSRPPLLSSVPAQNGVGNQGPARLVRHALDRIAVARCRLVALSFRAQREKSLVHWS